MKRFDADKIDKIIADIPEFYKKEIKNTYVGAALREALVIGSGVAMDAAITAMAMNPITATLSPILRVVWETEQASGQPMTREVIERIGMGLGLGLRVGNGLRVGSGLYMRGDGLCVGKGGSNKVQVIKHKIDTKFLENKLNNEPTEAPKIAQQNIHEGKLIVGAGGDLVITGDFLKHPVMSGIVRPRKLAKVSILTGMHN